MKILIQRATARSSPFQQIINRSLTHLSSGSIAFSNTNIPSAKFQTTEQIKTFNYNKSFKVLMSSYDPPATGTAGDVEEEPIQNEGGNETKLYVGNLDWNTTEDRLREVFADFGNVTEVFLPLNRETQRPRGFGFVTISSEQSANDIIERMNETELDGRMIKVNETFQKGPRTTSGFQQQGAFNAAGLADVKLYVGNIPFDTTEGEVLNMFEEFGTVSDCFFPTDRETGNFRGFAFVTMPAAEAEAASQQLNGHELNGRSIRVNEAQARGAGGPPRGGGYGGGGGGYQGGGGGYGGGGGGYNQGGGGGYGGGGG